jgi:alpha-L-fucosidase
MVKPVLSVLVLSALVSATYQPTWASLNTRPFPAWYNEAKVGFKIHWGPYSVPGYGDKALSGQEPVFAQSCLYEYFYNTPGTPTYEFHTRVYGDVPYGNFGPNFRAELYDPDQWADLFARAGAKYSYMTMKHGDGFCLFDSSTQPYWNSVFMGAKRDLYGDFVSSMHRRGLKAGVFVELSEASNPQCPCDVLNATSGARRWGNCTTSQNCAGRDRNCTTAYRDYLHTQIRESVERYKPDLVYLDDNAIANYMPHNTSSSWFESLDLVSGS